MAAKLAPDAAARRDILAGLEADGLAGKVDPVLLEATAQCLAQLRRISVAVDKLDELTVRGDKGQPRPHPLLRQQGDLRNELRLHMLAMRSVAGPAKPQATAGIAASLGAPVRKVGAA